jgi:signal peptidase I
MDERRTLSVIEFVQDIRGVVLSPRRRFSIIHDRGALGGSLLLMLAPAYLAFSFLGGIYFDREPFPGYSLLVPALAAILSTFLKTYFIHFFARLLEGRGRYFSATGNYRNQVVLIGYAGIPELMCLVLASCVFLLMPDEMGYLLRHLRVATMSVLISLGIAFFLWNLILVVLALRNVYPMHDMKILLAVIVGSVLLGISARILTNPVARPADVDVSYVLPIVNERMGRLFATDPSTEEQKPSRLDFHADQLAYRWKQPRRFDLVFFTPSKPVRVKDGTQGGIIVGKAGVSEAHRDDKALVRVLGLPGETLEIKQGQLVINGQAWAEPYITGDWRSNASISSRSLGPSEYFVLPENRHLLDSGYLDFVINRSRISGRMVTNKWPLGWWLLQPSVFLKGYPEPATRNP